MTAYGKQAIHRSDVDYFQDTDELSVIFLPVGPKNVLMVQLKLGFSGFTLWAF